MGKREQVSLDLQAAFPEAKGFSARNLWNMKKWYSFYTSYEDFGNAVNALSGQMDISSLKLQQVAAEIQETASEEKLQQVVAEIPFPVIFGFIPWGHHIEIITKCKDLHEALFYVKRTIEEGWSRNALDNCIRADMYHAVGSAVTNFSEKLPTTQGELAQEILKSNYDLGFVSLPPKYDENAYEQSVANEKIDSLILIPTFICDFLCIHPFNDGNGRMSRLLTLLLLYKNGYSVGKYISIEKQIEKTKDRYYDTLEASDAGWHEEKSDPTPFIRYMLQAILACYTEFEERVGLMSDTGNGSTAYDIVKKYTEKKIGKFTGAEVVAHCPSIGRSSALAALKRLTEEGLIVREGSGRSTFYVRADSK